MFTGYPFDKISSVPGHRDVRYIEPSNGLLDAVLRTSEMTKISMAVSTLKMQKKH
jgi:hypothetical protein